MELRNGQYRRCSGNPSLYLDGTRISDRDDPIPLDMIPTIDIEVVEIYDGPATTPAEFSGSTSQCGVIAIWTRRGG